MLNNSSRSTCLCVDLSAIEHNVKQIKMHLSKTTEIMGVVKAFGYGCGSVPVAQTLLKSGVARLAVALPYEGELLRKEGITCPILVFIPPNDSEIPQLLKHNLTASVLDYETAYKINEYSASINKTTSIHIELDTGMARTGMVLSQALALIESIKMLGNISIEGLFTHFSSADSDKEFTQIQINLFNRIIDSLEAKGINIPIKHVCNSAGLLWFPEAHFDMVRPGIMLYGYYPSSTFKTIIDLRPCLTLKSSICCIRDLPSKSPISYNQSYTTTRPSRIATIPMGYADGYRRELSNKGFVIIRNKKAPVVGNVCMDLFMVDITDIPDAVVSDPVTIFDHQNITLEEVASSCSTINYEIMTSISPRVPRIYK